MIQYIESNSFEPSGKLLFAGQALVAVGTMMITLRLIFKFRGEVVIPGPSYPVGNSADLGSSSF